MSGERQLEQTERFLEVQKDRAVSAIRGKLPVGLSLTHCEECSHPIPEKRRESLPGVTTCVPCQELAEVAG